MKRCDWVTEDPLYIKYHDEEWGVPVHDDRVHFEFLVLESAQAGLSWITVLKKRENYRLLYDNFDYEKVALYDENKIEELLSNKGIIRNRRKIESSINNANRFMEVQREFGSFDNYIWSFVENKVLINSWATLGDVPASTDLSDKISKDMKKRGFKFIGTTIIYSYLQAVGIINDHTTDCFRYEECMS
ncbi:DNA-3-methyladenine glycosylase I [Anaeromicrobium sediminis]|uniref:DNA-3-methyladenine glycosylase I n=1 Tax=Anaeromicrobium sediminis TaxID=1478221 RepID=A0A267ME78_9FIRM|nr:DNA-3-methyladenine glycosylase I [Anaeromicrobium sediminis]PAB57884.1 DNA-3-methyladenine glycosylase I [Anaeromicrobium sediminis]